MKSVITILGLASVSSAHTLFTTFFVDGENQGDGTCVRMPKDGATSNAPIYPLTGDDMACGRDGEVPVPFICPAAGGSTLTFEFRESPNAAKPGSIDESHQGPCSVYLKKVDDMFSDSAAGDGWFKIWEDGYDADTGKWCVDTLIENNGLLSVNLPTGLPSGYYLARPELLALHQAYRGDPQFYQSCAQIFIENGPETELAIPSEYAVSIPGYIEADHPGLTFNLYSGPPTDYKIPGPPVYIPVSSSSGKTQIQSEGAIPDSCILKNGNWCAKPVPTSSDVESCWDSVDDCWTQSEQCWDSAPVSGGAGCEVWADYCTSLGAACKAGDYNGPAKFTGKEVFAPVPGAIPDSYGNVFEKTKVNTGNGKVVEDEDKETTPSETGDVEEPAVSEPVLEPVPEPEQPEPEQPELVVSKDGRCGGETGQTCVGSSFGDCCSKKGRCGRKTRHCTCGCQSDFGECRQY
ncbi:glycosyl hydrolase family 61-domain-containing protein [Emericellopsis atlantica]|uniref:lytic cellulose monooxygenase (C4-dehydrogenating) n=1 Tax=Emericellopsis atlantica TaxID=2614577 RepID=A0A9P7ZWG4_9HYPO|nr:glycosyl hydrolase family 61-domain-containing protein [Emericellopsis atlantica]KAG9259196.1 glycosyl hydrolase family 61-domain-containing protein [Emericellopsis atlantica]